MTSGTPSWHPDIEQLADLAEELTDPADLPALQQHLADCPECTDTCAALTEVRELLGSTDTPPMPADVAARIDAALAAEAAPLEAAGVVRRAAVPAPPNRARDSVRPNRGRRRRRILLGAAALTAVLGLGSAIALQQQSSGMHSSGASVAVAKSGSGQQGEIAPGGQVYREELLTGQIQQLLAGHDAIKNPSFGAQPRAAESTPECLAAATGHPGATPLATGHGSYGAAEVTALVYPVAGQPGQVDVYLVTPVCPGATVLLHRTVPTS